LNGLERETPESVPQLPLLAKLSPLPFSAIPYFPRFYYVTVGDVDVIITVKT